MKIQWIITNINMVGGIERVVAQLSNYFVDRGLEVEIVSLYSKYTNSYFNLVPEVEVHNLNTPMNLSKNWRMQLVKTIYRIAKLSDADIVIGCHEDICTAMVINKKLFKGSIIVSQHVAIDFFTKKRLILNSAFFRFADGFVVLSENSKQFYEKMKINNCIVIPNAITNTITSQSLKNFEKEKLIITAGRLTAVKGYDLLIQSFSLVHDVYPEWKCKILGDGEDRNKLVQLARKLNLENDVILPGFSKNVTDELRKASVFVLTSQSEGFSMILLEAMSQGLPVVCVDIPVIREILENGKDGVLAKRNVNDFASALNNMLSDEHMRYEYGIKAFERSKDYLMEQIGKRWIALFQKLCRKK